MKKSLSKIVLGTVQLGMDYGISNQQGKPTNHQSMSILDYAVNHGINTFDTAPSYGDSEEILGSFMKRQKTKLNVITKLKSISATMSKNHVKNSVKSSLKRLNKSRIEGILVHNLNDYFSNREEMIRQLKEIQSDNLVDLIGISIYNKDDVDDFLSVGWGNMVQIPYNLFDHRLQVSGTLDDLRSAKIKIFARSIFLQGLFFMDPNRLPTKIREAKSFLEELNRIAVSENLSVLELALRYASDNPLLDHLLLGVETKTQLENNLKILNHSNLSQTLIDEIHDCFSEVPSKILDPRLW